jgi:hypothetical protein
MWGVRENHESTWYPIGFMVLGLTIATKQESCQNEAIVSALIYEVIGEL